MGVNIINFIIIKTIRSNIPIIPWVLYNTNRIGFTLLYEYVYLLCLPGDNGTSHGIFCVRNSTNGMGR